MMLLQKKSDSEFRKLLLLRTLVKRKRHDLGVKELAANVDLDRLAGIRKFRGHVSHADVLFEKRRGTPGSDFAQPLIVYQDILSIARDAAISYLEPDKFAFYACIFLFL